MSALAQIQKAKLTLLAVKVDEAIEELIGEIRDKHCSLTNHADPVENIRTALHLQLEPIYLELDESLQVFGGRRAR